MPGIQFNHSVVSDSFQPHGLQGDQTSPEYHWKDGFWSWNSNTLATWCEELTHLKRPWCWERLQAGERDDREWDGITDSMNENEMASRTQWTWVWVNSGSWQWTGRPGMLQSMGLKRVRHNWLNWTELMLTGCKTSMLYGVIVKWVGVSATLLRWSNLSSVIY